MCSSESWIQSVIKYDVIFNSVWFSSKQVCIRYNQRSHSQQHSLLSTVSMVTVQISHVYRFSGKKYSVKAGNCYMKGCCLACSFSGTNLFSQVRKCLIVDYEGMLKILEEDGPTLNTTLPRLHDTESASNNFGRLAFNVRTCV